MNNAEIIVIKWLESLLKDVVPVFGDKPKDTPNDKYILVDRTGGGRAAMVMDRAEILIEVYSKISRQDASEIANNIADHLHELKEFSEDLTRAEVNSLVKLDDLTNQYYRYQIYCDVWVRR